MSQPSKKTEIWREIHREEIKQWQEKVQGLRKLANTENWHYERTEMEIAQLIKRQDLFDIFIFAKNYIVRHKRGSFRNMMKEVLIEIYNFGTIETSNLHRIKRAINTARRKIM